MGSDDHVMDEKALEQELFRNARDSIVPLGKLYKGKTIDVVASTDEGLSWLVYVWNKAIARGSFRDRLRTYLFDASIKRELENLGLEVAENPTPSSSED